MKRKVERELLDEVLPSDHRAIGSRRDLQKIDAWMLHARIMTWTLTGAFAARPPRSIVELGVSHCFLAQRVAERRSRDDSGF